MTSLFACVVLPSGHMVLAKSSAFVRKLLPPAAFSVVRRIATAVLTPLAFAWDTGHFRSSLLAAPVDTRGVPVPWYTFPMISFLEAKTFRGCRVLEFGAGYSTLWWAERAASVVSFEANKEWYASLAERIPANVALNFCPSKKPTLEDIIKHGELFDIIIIDGLNRPHCAGLVTPLLAPGGAIIIDNSEGYGWEIGESITGLFRGTFSRVDFYGYCPGVIKRHCSSLLFRENTFLLAGDEPPLRFE